MVQVGPALCCQYGIGLDCPPWRRSVADSSQVREQILVWNEKRTPDRSAKTAANRRCGELRRQNDSTTLQALTCHYMPYRVTGHGHFSEQPKARDSTERAGAITVHEPCA